MKKYFMLTALVLMLGLSGSYATDPWLAEPGTAENAIKVTIIYDNYPHDKDLRTDWGFACLVECQGNRLLFDAGRMADLYRENTGKLGIDPGEIPTLFITHEHGDHTGGITWITERNPSIECYLPTPYFRQLKDSGTLPVNSQAVPDARHLCGPFYSTGDSFEAFTEQGLVVKTENGGVLITGCGHPGPVAMVSRAQEELGIRIHTVIGGLHLLQMPGEKIEQIAAELKALGVKQICPTHCTGDKSIALLKEAFGEGYITGGAGKEVIIQ